MLCTQYCRSQQSQSQGHTRGTLWRGTQIQLYQVHRVHMTKTQVAIEHCQGYMVDMTAWLWHWQTPQAHKQSR